MASTSSCFIFASILGAAAAAGACNGCRTPSTPRGEAGAGTPTVRLYLVSDVAGALEPCGCTKDQLGGLDHASAWMASERARAPVSALVSAGPLFFMDPVLTPEKAAQDTQKAETMASLLKQLDLAAFAPAKNEWAKGSEELGKLRETSGAALLFANGAPASTGATGASPFVVRDLGGVKVGFIGVAMPDVAGVSATPPGPAAKEAFAAAKKQGAAVVIALASVGRGEAKRIADVVPELTAIVVGSTGGAGEANTKAPPPERVGNVLIAETGNHLQTVGVLDLFVRDGTATFADGTGLELGEKREELSARIDELHVKIAAWELDPKIAKIQKADLDARRAELAKLEAERAALDAPKPPPSGSFFRFAVKEIRESLGKDPKLQDELLAYYKRVNLANKTLFANRTPRPPEAGQPSYAGIEACTPCHEGARKVWNGTRHANAYQTLKVQFKEYNLDCVSCHVTGYDAPGGATVTHTDKLEAVQCEVCHGPGSAHAKDPKVAVPTPRPRPSLCVGCHHPPHVEGFDARLKIEEILGPGHGRKS